uniref:Helix-loop-helix protein 1 n=1 Tax=Schistosoma haematobium TaxID=6185 RepID=A0A095ARF1_SCHHA
MNSNSSIRSNTLKHSLCNNLYSSFVTSTSDLTTTMMMMLNRKKGTNSATTTITTSTTTTTAMTMTTTNQKNNLSMIIEHKPIFNHYQTTTNILSINNNNNNITENQLNLYKKQYSREYQRYKRASLQYRYAHAARERQRVAEFNKVFKKLHSLLPIHNYLSSNRRLSKLQILKLCSSYIYNFTLFTSK